MYNRNRNRKKQASSAGGIVVYLRDRIQKRHHYPDSRSLSPIDFAYQYLPDNFSEADLEEFVFNHYYRHKWGARRQTPIPTGNTTRYSDIETWNTRVEIKKVLGYGDLYRAKGQLEIYGYYGLKIFGLFPKKQVILGLAPMPTEKDPQAYNTAVSLAIDLAGMGIEVIFINERPKMWNTSHWLSWENISLILLGVAIASLGYLLAALFF